MNDVEFRICVETPIALTLDLAKEVTTNVRPRWRISTIDLRRVEENVFDCKVGISRDDLSKEDVAGLIEFRDQFLSLLAFTAMAPVRLKNLGLFTFPVGENKFAQLSLGAMKKTFPPTALPSAGSLVDGLALPEAEVTSLRFIWKSLNSDEPLDRFINLAIAFEILVGAHSPAPGSKHPTCSDCGHEISECLACTKEIRIPTTLRERATFLFEDDSLLSSFVRFRNRVFHGGLNTLDKKSITELINVNNALLVNIRNYLGKQLGLAQMRLENLSIALNAPQVYMTVYYTVPPKQSG